MNTILDDTLEEKEPTDEIDKELKKTEERLTDEINVLQNKRDNLPDQEEIMKEAHQIRTRLKRKYYSEEHLQNMSFKDKKMLLQFLFDGKAPNGDEYSIYIDKRGAHKDAEIDCFMVGRLTGHRTLKGDDIDYFPGDDEGSVNGGNSSQAKSQSSHRKTIYKRPLQNLPNHSLPLRACEAISV